MLSKNISDGGSVGMFGPLTFKEDNDLDSTENTSCMLCEDTFNLKIGLGLFLRHVLEVHHVIIEDVQNIVNLRMYVLHWKNRFSEIELERIIPSVVIDSKEQKYFLLSSLIKEDKEVRHRLKLEFVLKLQDFERTDGTFKRICLFCKLDFEGVRAEYLNHLSVQHNLQLGNPQNLVHVDELIDKIDANLQALHCIYCEKEFPDRPVLKEHMRKKLHKRINPKNRSYDKYYIVNYLEPGKSWMAIQNEDDRIIPSSCGGNSDEEYYDWEEKEDTITCLFCRHRETGINSLCEHMRSEHNFDFCASTRSLDFYQRLKLVNYCRRQVYNVRCTYCDVRFNVQSELISHMKENAHFILPQITTFDQPEFYFPTFENDAFLYFLDNLEDFIEETLDSASRS